MALLYPKIKSETQMQGARAPQRRSRLVQIRTQAIAARRAMRPPPCRAADQRKAMVPRRKSEMARRVPSPSI
eukprot:1004376-Lingulodinium_polyedra.AAC.1